MQQDALCVAVQINFCGLEHVLDGNACLTYRWRLPHRFIHYGKNYSSVIDGPHVRVQGLWNTGGVVTACLWSLATSHSLPRLPFSPVPSPTRAFLAGETNHRSQRQAARAHRVPHSGRPFRPPPFGRALTPASSGGDTG